MSAIVRRRADVLGAGPVGLTCARILAMSGWSVRVLKTGLQSSRPIALPGHTAQIVDEIWGRPISAICRVHPLAHRRVTWSEGDVGQDAAFPSMSVDLAELCLGLEALLRGRVSIEEAQDGQTDSQACVLDARGALPPERCRISAGRRVMHMWQDVPADSRATRGSEVRAGSGFWVFLLPTSADKMSVQVVAPDQLPTMEHLSKCLAEAPRQTLARCLEISLPELAGVLCAGITIAPRLGPLPSDPRRIPVGDRAIAYDPICGDGTGQGLRTAILAAAALNTLETGRKVRPILDHVVDRYLFAFRAHLEHSLRYYRSITWPNCWRGEIASTRRALAELQDLNRAPAGAAHLHYDNPRGAEGPIFQAVN